MHTLYLDGHVKILRADLMAQCRRRCRKYDPFVVSQTQAAHPAASLATTDVLLSLPYPTVPEEHQVHYKSTFSLFLKDSCCTRLANVSRASAVTLKWAPQ